MPSQASLTLFNDALPIPAKIIAAANATITINLQVGLTSLHSDLPPTAIWGYNGTYPGPVIEVCKGHKIHVEWRNRLKTCFLWPYLPEPLKSQIEAMGNVGLGQRFCFPADLPISVVTAPTDTQSEAGRSGGVLDLTIPDIPPFTVAHLHGANTHPDSDGWTESGLLVDQSAFYTYENQERGTMFWFHDHAMGITRLNVYAGLAGLYLLRDAEELGLHLPSGSFEIPLVLQDKNLETDAQGNLTGRLLHKVEGREVSYVDSAPEVGHTSILIADGTMEFFGPFNLVNGKISPFLEVKRGVYRFRIVNGSNGRTYKLRLLDDATNLPVTTGLLTQIGSDGGLFKTPVPLPGNELILAPGERADVIADFRANEFKGKNFNWVNVAKAPYDGTDVSFTDPKTLDNDPAVWKELRQRNACVIQFRVQNYTLVCNNFKLPAILTNSFVRMTHADLPHKHPHRFIALVEEQSLVLDSKGKPIDDPDNPGQHLTEPMLMLRELHELKSGEVIPPGEFKITIEGVTYKSVASTFYDPVQFMISYGATEAWKILNLTADTHPFHVHLVQFQALGRQKYKQPILPKGKASSNAVGAMEFNLTFAQSTPEDNLLDANEKGWKDTIRVNPNEAMTIAMRFDGHSGRYMYHCHLLEHEDREMMRPFIVLPQGLAHKTSIGCGGHM